MPWRIYRYITARFLSTFLVGIAVFSAVLLMDQASRQVDQLAPHSRGLLDFAISFSLLAPPLLSYSIPLAFLMALITCLEQMKENRELQAVLGAGLSPLSLFLPVMALASAVFAVVVLVSTLVGPASYRLYNGRLARIASEKFLGEIRPGSFFKGFPGTVLLVGDINRDDGRMSGLLLVREGEAAGDLVVARSGTIRPSEPGSRLMLLNLYGGNIHPVSAQERDYSTASFERLSTRFETAQAQPVVRSRQLFFAARLSELRSQAAQARAEGDAGRAAALEMELGRRFAMPSLILLYPFLVFPLAISVGRYGKAAAFSASIVLFMMSFFLFSLGSKLGSGGLIPAPLAPYLPVAVVGCLAAAVFARFAHTLRRRTPQAPEGEGP